MADSSYVVTSKKLPSPVANVSLTFIDPAVALDSQEKWLKSFQDVVVRKAR